MGVWVFTLGCSDVSGPRAAFLGDLPLAAATAAGVKCQGRADPPALRAKPKAAWASRPEGAQRQSRGPCAPAPRHPSASGELSW